MAQGHFAAVGGIKNFPGIAGIGHEAALDQNTGHFDLAQDDEGGAFDSPIGHVHFAQD